MKKLKRSRVCFPAQANFKKLMVASLLFEFGIIHLPEQLSVQQLWLVIQTHAWSARSESSDVGWSDPGSVEVECCRAGIDPGSASPSAPWWPSCNKNRFGARLFCQLGIFPTSALPTSNFILSWKNRATETLVAKSQLTQITMTECHWGIWVTF